MLNPGSLTVGVAVFLVRPVGDAPEDGGGARGHGDLQAPHRRLKQVEKPVRGIRGYTRVSTK